MRTIIEEEPTPEKRTFSRTLRWGLAAGVLVAALILLAFLLAPNTVDSALNDLQASDTARRQQALVTLVEAAPDDSARPKVTAALEPMLLAGDVRGELSPDLLLRAYLHWAGPDNVPTLISIVENPNLPSWDPRKTAQVMSALGGLKDKRAIDVLAGKLADPALRDAALTSLQLMGHVAEGAVLDYLFDPDPVTRQRAGQLLADYGTREQTITAAALGRLKSNQPELRVAAAAWFADNPPSAAAPPAEVSRALADLLGDLSPKVNAAALRALKLWGTKDCLPQLLALARRQAKAGANDPALIDVLSRFSDETAADAIALQLENPAQRDEAVRGLVKLGPAATGAVLKYINHPDPAVRKEARSLATLLQVPAGRLVEQTLADVAATDVARSRAAIQSLAGLRPDTASRAKVAQALNVPLLDADVGVREDALNAVRVWGTKENTATLLKLYGDVRARDPACTARVVAILGALKDPTAAPTLAQGLTDPRSRELVGRALLAMGPGAEAAVIPFLQSLDAGARVVACQILAEIGTDKSLEALRAASLATPTDFAFTAEARLATEKIEARR